MYDFGKKTLFLDQIESPITSFVVNFVTPWGMFETLEEASEKCLELDMDPTLLIQPIIIIVDNDGRSEVFLRTK